MQLSRQPATEDQTKCRKDCSWAGRVHASPTTVECMHQPMRAGLTGAAAAALPLECRLAGIAARWPDGRAGVRLCIAGLPTWNNHRAAHTEQLDRKLPQAPPPRQAWQHVAATRGNSTHTSGKKRFRKPLEASTPPVTPCTKAFAEWEGMGRMAVGYSVQNCWVSESGLASGWPSISAYQVIPEQQACMAAGEASCWLGCAWRQTAADAPAANSLCSCSPPCPATHLHWTPRWP